MSWRDFIDDAQRLAMWAVAGSGPAPYEIVPYRGFGTATRVLVLGRAIQSKEIDPAREHDSTLINLINTYKRIDSDPLRHARVHVSVGGIERDIVADNEGFIREWIDL